MQLFYIEFKWQGKAFKRFVLLLSLSDIMKIREIENMDWDELSTILAEALSPQYMDEMHEEFDYVLGGRYIGIVAEEDREILGYACAGKLVQTYELKTIAVRHDAQGRGIGSMLVDSVADYARKDGVKILNVDTDSSDEQTVNFYKRNGFEISGHVRDEYIPGVTQVHLRREL